MPIIRDSLPYSDVRGVRWHKPCQKFIAELGYHRISRIAADGSITIKRVRTTHYLGSLRRREEAESKYAALKEDWQRCVAESPQMDQSRPNSSRPGNHGLEVIRNDRDRT